MTLQEIQKQDPTFDFGLANYPIFDESYRAGLNQKILDEFWNREIGASNPLEFRLWMRRRMNKIMPFYNQMYESQRLIIDPLNTVDISTVNDATGNSRSVGDMAGSSNSTGESIQKTTADAKSRTVNMDTPQNELSETGDYATNAQDSISETGSSADATNTENSSNNVNSQNTSDTTSHMMSNTKGYSGSQAVLLNEYRKTFLNIDADIIDELKDLFMQIYGNGNDILNTPKGVARYAIFNPIY